MKDREFVRLDRVTCAYGRTPVLTNIGLTIWAGDYLGVVGPSGSGKSTLLKALMGTVRPVAGSVETRPGLAVGYVPQVETVDWNFPVTVSDVVLMGRTRRYVPWATHAERALAETMLGRLGLDGLGPRHIRELSGGQQQRVFIARALLADPDILLLDEPTSGVDVATRHELLHLLSELNAAGMTIVLTTHDLNGVAAHLPTLACLNVELIAHGPPHEVLIPEVLERTYGAELEVLQHGGMRVVVDRGGAPHIPRTGGRR